MNIKLKRGSALFLSIILFLQILFIIPMEVRGDSIDIARLSDNAEVPLHENIMRKEDSRSTPLADNIANSSVVEDFKFTNITFTDKNGDVFSADNPYSLEGDEIGNLNFTFHLVDGHRVKAGDILSFHLPKKLKPINATHGYLGEIGTWSVSANGLVTFVFNNNVDGDDVAGSFFFRVFLDENEIDDSVEQVIEFEEYPEFKLFFPVIPKGGTSIDKNGTINRQGYNATEAYWTVDINTVLLRMVTPVITDVIPVNMVFKEDSLTIRTLDVNSKGIRTPGEILSPDLYTVEVISGNPTITLHGLKNEELQKAYRIEYSTDIVEPEEGFSGVQTFTNQAQLTTDSKSSIAQSTVSSGYKSSLTKKIPTYDSEKQQHSWAIEYNYNEKFIPIDQAWLSDSWTPVDTMRLIEDSLLIFEVEIDEKGTPTISAFPVSEDLYKLTYEEGKGFTIQFLQDNNGQGYLIRYKTQMMNKDGETIITDGGRVYNKVETGQGKISSQSGGYGQQSLIKNRTGIDIVNKDIHFELLINRNSYTMENLTLKDQFSGDGLSLLKDTLIILDSMKQPLIENIDYILNYTAPLDNVPGSFEIKFLRTISTPHTVRYSTHYEANNDGTSVYRNTVGIVWQHEEREYKIDNVFVNTNLNGYTVTNGIKSGSYNAAEKKITWSIHTNTAKLSIGDPYVISDTLDSTQVFVDDSLSIFTYDINSAGTITNEVAMNPEAYQIEFPSAQNGNKIAVALTGHVGEKVGVGIRFKTKFKNELINAASISNIASLQSGNTKFSLKATVSIPYGGKLVDKTGVQTGMFNERVDWSVYLNPTQSKLSEYILTDSPDLNSILLKDTFKVVKGTVAPDGTITASNIVLEKDKDYTLEFYSNPLSGKEHFELKFLYEITEAYILSYSSYIDPLAPQGELIKNAYTATGKNMGEHLNSGATAEIIKKNDGGGSGQSIRGGLSITKNNELNEMLPGAHFALYTSDGKQLIREGVTDNHGQLTFKELRRGKYLLKEIEAPKGYVISAELAEGIEIILDHATDGELKLLSCTNEKTKAIIRKVSADETLILEEASFDLYTADDNIYRQNLKTSNGVILLEDLPVGNYYLIETKAPEGFIRNVAKHYFDIKIEENGTQKIPVVDVINYKSSVTLKKTDRNGNALTGAVFNLIDAYGNTIKSNITVDGMGILKIDNLSPGNYELSEVKAPIGYILNTERIPFNVPMDGSGSPETIYLGEFVNYQGSLIINKVDETGHSLEGAEFKLKQLDGDMKEILLLSDKNGTVRINNLAPGRYELVETKAPHAYSKSNEIYNFTVENFENGNVQPIEITIVNSLELDDTESKSPGNILPSAGESYGIIYFPLFGILLIILGSLYLISHKKYI